MFKKILPILIAVFLFTGNAFAVPIVTGFDEARAGAFYDFSEGELLAGLTIPILTYNDLLSLNAGILGDGNDSEPIVTIGINIEKLAKSVGADFTLPAPFDAGVFTGYDPDDKGVRYGVYVGIFWELGG